MLLYIYKFAASDQEGQDDNKSEITQQKFIGISLFIIGYTLELIFGG